MSQLEFRKLRQSVLGLSFAIPDPEDVWTEANDRKRNRDRAVPYWARIWPSSLALSEFLKNHIDLYKGKTVIELGAGIALPSFIVSAHASEVVASDLDPDAVRWMKENAKDLGLSNLNCAVIDWRDQNLLLSDVVLLSDVGYEISEHSTLKRLIENSIKNRSMVLLSVPHRTASLLFLNMLDELKPDKILTCAEGVEILLLIFEEQSAITHS